MTETVKIRLLHRSSIPNARWCQPIGWEPANDIPLGNGEDAEYADGAWWGPESEEAAIVCFAQGDEGDEGDEIEVPLDDLRVVRSGDCRVIGPVETYAPTEADEVVE